MTQSTKTYADLIETVALLRAPEGCPWDREQTHQSLTECLIEECSELIEAIDANDIEHMREEIGDVLLNLLMQAEIAREAGHFDMEAVCSEIHDKLIRRHPHVFARDANSANNPEQVVKRWEEIKAGEKKNGSQPATDSPFKPQPPRLPALLFAKKTFRQIEKAGLTSHPAIPSAKIDEFRQVTDDTALGEILFSVAAACRIRGIDPEQITRAYTQDLVKKLS